MKPILDPEFEYLLDLCSWRQLPTGYWQTRINGQSKYLHRIVMRAQKGEIVDHINGDKNDNRRTNLRLVTKAQNAFNCKGHKDRRATYKGVSLWKSPWKSRLWRARIRANGVEYSLGYYQSQEDAARAYDAAAKKLHGPHARLNFNE